MQEWSLILFTILVQSAAGLVVAGEVIPFSAKGKAGGLLSRQLPVACVLAGLGLVASLAHLGSPLHGVFTISNLGVSWLSREILATGVFFALLVALTVLRHRKARCAGLTAATVLAGLAAVFAMSRVYLLRTVPVWDNGATTLSFFGTMFFMGAVLYALLMALDLRDGAEIPRDRYGRLFGAAIVLAAFGATLQFIGIPLSIVSGTGLHAQGPGALDALLAYGAGMVSLRVALLAVGCILFAWASVRVILNNTASVVALGTVAALCVLAGEVIGRLMFYASYTRIGL